MPVRRNSYYNDPSIGEAFNNLAGMFKVPSGTDLYGYAHAAATRAKEARLSDMFKVVTDPNTPRETIDRYGIGAGAFNPNQSFYSVDQSNATSRANNAADNTRAIDVARINEGGQLDRAMIAPVAAGATRFLPPTIAEMYSVPQQQVGNIELKPNEITVTADNRRLEGKDIRSTDQVRAGWMQNAALNGDLTQNAINAIVMKDVPLEVIRNADGTVQNVFRPDAAGKVPVLNEEKAGKAQLANYKKPGGGGEGTARFDQNTNAWHDTQTNERLPAGTITYGANVQGKKDDVLSATTSNQSDATKRAAEVTRTLDTLDLYEGLIRNNPGVVGLPGLIRGTAQNAAATAADLAKAFGKSVPRLEEATKEIRSGLQNVAPEFFNPAIPEASFYQGALAYALARTENPSGEVSRQAFDRALERMRGGVLSNPDQILATIGAHRKLLQAEQGAIGTLREPKQGRTDTQFRDPQQPAPVERWERGPDGALRRAQ